MKTFLNAFHFLKGPPKLQQPASEAIYRSMTAMDGKVFWDYLPVAQVKHAGDARINLWLERFLLRRAGEVKLNPVEMFKARQAIERIVLADGAANALRIRQFSTLKAGDKIPVSFAELAFGILPLIILPLILILNFDRLRELVECLSKMSGGR